jgi:hypothetical protein
MVFNAYPQLFTSTFLKIVFKTFETADGKAFQPIYSWWINTNTLNDDLKWEKVLFCVKKWKS